MKNQRDVPVFHQIFDLNETQMPFGCWTHTHTSRTRKYQ